MAWTTPRSWVTGELVTAAQLNTHVRDNFNALNIPLGAGATVASAQTTTSTSFTDLSTSGPAVTLTTGADVVVFVTAEINHNSIRHYMAVAVSGATTRAANSNEGLLVISNDTYADVRHAASFVITDLTPGSNTFTCKYKVDSGTGTFGLRHLNVTRHSAVS